MPEMKESNLMGQESSFSQPEINKWCIDFVKDEQILAKNSGCVSY